MTQPNKAQKTGTNTSEKQRMPRKHVEECSTAFAMEETWNYNTVSSHTAMAKVGMMSHIKAGGNREKLELSPTAGGSVKWCKHSAKLLEGFL